MPDRIVRYDFDAPACMIDTKNISGAGKAVGRVHDLRDAHSCMKKKCMEEGVGDARFSCGMQLGSEDSRHHRSLILLMCCSGSRAHQLASQLATTTVA